MRLLTSGASPVSADVLLFLRICFGCCVLEGYGMTETSCLISITPLGDAQLGHVGAPTPACEVKLADLPEMGYTNADSPSPRGEICVRGPILFRGYYKDEAATRETIDAEGWLHTGDVGAWLPGGRLKIIDRKKNIFKLAQGEYVAPEKIENVYARSPLVMQSFVYGDSLRAQLVAVVVPDPEAMLPWAAQRGLPQDLRALCDDPKASPPPPPACLSAPPMPPVPLPSALGSHGPGLGGSRPWQRGFGGRARGGPRRRHCALRRARLRRAHFGRAAPSPRRWWPPC